MGTSVLYLFSCNNLLRICVVTLSAQPLLASLACEPLLSVSQVLINLTLPENHLDIPRSPSTIVD